MSNANTMCRSVNVDNSLTWRYKHCDSRSKYDFEVVVFHTGTEQVTKTSSVL